VSVKVCNPKSNRVTWSFPVLETITVTEVFPLNCGGVAAGEPQPVLPPRPSNDIRVIRKESDNAEGAEDQSAISNPASPDFANSKRECYVSLNSIIVGGTLSSYLLIRQKV